jgi:hypothetical protein
MTKIVAFGGLVPCARQLLTGTHIPSWICRYQEETDANRNLTQDYLKQPRNCATADCIGH